MRSALQIFIKFLRGFLLLFISERGQRLVQKTKELNNKSRCHYKMRHIKSEIEIAPSAKIYIASEKGVATLARGLSNC